LADQTEREFLRIQEKLIRELDGIRMALEKCANELNKFNKNKEEKTNEN